MTRRVVMDATPLLFGGAGVGRVTRTLLDQMVAQQPAFEFFLYARCLRGPRVQYPGCRTFHARLPQCAEPLVRACGLIERVGRGDLYHATDHYLPLRHADRCVATVHDMMFLTHREAGLETHARQARLVPPFLERCRRIIAVSESTRRDILSTTRVAPDRIDVVPWAVDRACFCPADDPESVRADLAGLLGGTWPFLLAVGCSTGRKNTPRLLEAFARVLATHPDRHLVLVWNPPDELRARYADHADRIHFTGRVSDAQLRDLYRAADMMVYPTRYEGFGLPVLEAMACGTPVITGRNTSLPEVGGDAAIYVDADDTGAIEGALRSACDGSVDFKALGARSLDQADRFSWERTARETLAVYERCLA